MDVMTQTLQDTNKYVVRIPNTFPNRPSRSWIQLEYNATQTKIVYEVGREAVTDTSLEIRASRYAFPNLVGDEDDAAFNRTWDTAATRAQLAEQLADPAALLQNPAADYGEEVQIETLCVFQAKFQDPKPVSVQDKQDASRKYYQALYSGRPSPNPKELAIYWNSKIAAFVPADKPRWVMLATEPKASIPELYTAQNEVLNSMKSANGYAESLAGLANPNPMYFMDKPTHVIVKPPKRPGASLQPVSSSCLLRV